MVLRNRRSFMIWLILTVLWMGFIFYKSAEPYQEQDIRPMLAEWIPQSVVDQWMPHIEFTYDGGLVTWKEPYDFIEFIIRKGGHIAEYALLTLLWIKTLRATKRFRSFAIPLGAVLSVLYAASDEWHQSFVEGRTGHAIDVGMDSVGVLLVACGYGVVLLLRRWRRAR